MLSRFEYVDNRTCWHVLGWPIFTLKIAPSLMGIWTHLSQCPERHCDQLSCFCRALDRDRQTDHATPPVVVGRI